jgi:Zn ribbon nucleic-acid-binding protein
MRLVCPECKNDVNLSIYPQLSVEQVIECDVCGISLLVTSISNENVMAEIVDEGK